jgi:hypothetical protein
LIIDNTPQGSAQPDGEPVQVTYSSGTIIAGSETSPDSFVSIGGILTVGGFILASAIVAIVALAVIYKSSRRTRSILPFSDRQDGSPADQEMSVRTNTDLKKPYRIYLQAKPVVRPIRVHAIGRCPVCNGIIAKDWTECTKCSWTVNRLELRLLK